MLNVSEMCEAYDLALIGHRAVRLAAGPITCARCPLSRKQHNHAVSGDVVPAFCTDGNARRYINGKRLMRSTRVDAKMSRLAN